MAVTVITASFTVGIQRHIATQTTLVSAPLSSQVDAVMPDVALLKAGDVLFAGVSNRSGLPIRIPSTDGWAHALASPIDYGTSIHTVVCQKLVGDPTQLASSYRWDLGGLADQTGWTAVVTAWRGLDQTSPVHQAVALNETEDLTTHSTDTLTPSEAGCWLVTLAVERLVSATPSGLSAVTATDVERADVSTAAPGALTAALYDSNAGVPSGAPVSRQVTSGNASRYVTTWLALLRPAGSTVPVGSEYDVGFVDLAGGPPVTPPNTYASTYASTY